MNRNGRTTSDGPETAIQQFHLIIDIINSFAFVVGIEFTSDWKYNSITVANMIMNLFYLWDEFYTMYVLFLSLSCVDLIAGMQVTVPVRYSVRGLAGKVIFRFLFVDTSKIYIFHLESQKIHVTSGFHLRIGKPKYG